MKKLILLISSIAFLVIFSGCQNIMPSPPKKIVDTNMPIVTGIKTLTDMTEVAFEWKPVYTKDIEGYRLYRSDPLKNDGKLRLIATIDDRYVSHYVDTKLLPGTMYYYRMSTFMDNRESKPSAVVEAKTMPLLTSVPFIKAVSGLPHRIKLIWRPHPNPRVSSYLVERNNLTDLEWKQIATVNGRLNAEFIDKNLPDNKVFRYRVRVKTYDGIISTPSDTVKGNTKPLPPIVTGVQASRDLPKRIVISWDKSPSNDVVYYNVYRATTPYLFYTYLAKTADTKFVDLIGEDGVARYYKVTAVDNQGLESIKQENPVMGTTLGKPASPVITNLILQGDSVKITWESGDSRAVKYNIIKKYGKGFSQKSVKFINIYSTEYIDKDIVPGFEYRYAVVAVDNNGIESKPTEYMTIEIPKAK